MRETFDWHSIFPSHDPLPLRRSILTILSSPRLVVVFVRPPPIEEHDKFVEAAVSTSWLAVSENGESVPRVPWIVEIVRLRSIRGRGQTWRVKCVSVRSDLAIDTKIDGGAARYTRGEGHRVLYVYNFEQTLDFVSLTVIASTRKGNEISKSCFDHTSFPILPRFRNCQRSSFFLDQSFRNENAI